MSDRKRTPPAWWKKGDWCWIGLVRDMAEVVECSEQSTAEENARGMREFAARLADEWGGCCAPCQDQIDAEAVADAVMGGGE